MAGAAHRGRPSARAALSSTGNGAGGTGWWGRIKDTPLAVPALVLVLSYLVSSAISLVPRISFFGSYVRLQGTLTFLSYMVLFGGVLTHLRTRRQVDRILHTIIITSLPVAIYGVIQNAGLDPLALGRRRARSRGREYGQCDLYRRLSDHGRVPHARPAVQQRGEPDADRRRGDRRGAAFGLRTCSCSSCSSLRSCSRRAAGRSWAWPRGCTSLQCWGCCSSLAGAQAGRRGRRSCAG